MAETENKAHWERVWSEKQPEETSWYQEVPTLSLSMIEDATPDRGAAIIDVGGGASLLVDCLLGSGYTDITVLDLSAAALDRARRRLGADAGRVEWIDADACKFTPARRYALWHDRAAFHFLTDPEDRKRYFEVLDTAVRTDGQAIIATFAPGGPKKCSGLDIVQHDAGGLLAELGPGWVLMDQCIEYHRTPSGAEQKFGFYRVGRTGPDD